MFRGRITPRTTTLPITTQDREIAAAFTPPRVTIGQPVIVWEKGVRGGDRYPGTIIADNFTKSPEGETVVNRNATIVLVNGSLLRNIPHVDDPKLNWNYAIRSSGAWEVAPYDIEKEKRIEAMLASVKGMLGEIRELYTAITDKAQKLTTPPDASKKNAKQPRDGSGEET